MVGGAAGIGGGGSSSSFFEQAINTSGAIAKNITEQIRSVVRMRLKVPLPFPASYAFLSPSNWKRQECLTGCSYCPGKFRSQVSQRSFLVEL